MSKESLEQFMNQVAESEELQAKIGEEIDVDALIALGAECGCEFTAEELQESAELSDEELDGVAGGFDVGPVGSHSQGVSFSWSWGETQTGTAGYSMSKRFSLRVRSNRIIDPQY